MKKIQFDLTPNELQKGHRINEILKDINDNFQETPEMPEVPVLYRELTYSELVAAIADNSLSPGESIEITDYKTTYIQPISNEAMEGTVEPLFVRAISNNELSPIAYSALFPQDIIYYNVDNAAAFPPIGTSPAQTIAPGATKGFIYRRIDTYHNNDFPLDFRQVKFRRYKINVTNEWDAATTYGLGAYVLQPGTQIIYVSMVESNLNKATSNTDYWSVFTYTNGVHRSFYPGSYFFSFPVDSTQYTDYNIYADVEYYKTSYNNKFSLSNYNIFYNFNNVTFGGDFGGNTFNFGARNCNFDAYFKKNTFCSELSNFFSGSDCKGNVFNGLVDMVIGVNSLSTNVFNSELSYIFFSANFSLNIIRSSLSDTHIRTNFKYNDINIINMSSILEGVSELRDKSYPHTVIMAGASNCVVTWYNLSGVLQTTLI